MAAAISGLEFALSEGTRWKEWKDKMGKSWTCPFLLFNWRVQYSVGFYHTSTWVSHRHTYVPSLLETPSHHPPSPTPLDCHRAPIWASCDLQQIPTGYLFYVWWCICFYVTHSIHPTLSFPCCVHKSVLCVCVPTPAPQIVKLSLFNRLKKIKKNFSEVSPKDCCLPLLGQNSVTWSSLAAMHEKKRALLLNFYTRKRQGKRGCWITPEKGHLLLCPSLVSLLNINLNFH